VGWGPVFLVVHTLSYTGMSLRLPTMLSTAYCERAGREPAGSERIELTEIVRMRCGDLRGPSGGRASIDA
jgi:hypothetical protein